MKNMNWKIVPGPVFFEIFQGLPCWRVGVEGLSALLDNSYWVKYSLTNNKEDST